MSSRQTDKPFEILLVEDSPGDARLAVEALKEGKPANNLYVVEDGEKALKFLHKETPFENKPRPDIILLDLNLPRLDGRQVLAKIKQDPNLRRIPVVILTTSDADEDILKTYDLHANSYITKPIDLDQFISIVDAIKNFWLSIVKLPLG